MIEHEGFSLLLLYEDWAQASLRDAETWGLRILRIPWALAHGYHQAVPLGRLAGLHSQCQRHDPRVAVDEVHGQEPKSTESRSDGANNGMNLTTHPFS
jgi:hypothetical protein